MQVLTTAPSRCMQVILSEKDVEWREERLEDEGVGLDGRALPNETIEPSIGSARAAAPSARAASPSARAASPSTRALADDENDVDSELSAAGGAAAAAREAPPSMYGVRSQSKRPGGSATPGRPRSMTQSSEFQGLRNARLVHKEGITTDHVALKKLPLDRATAVIVAADVDDVEADTQISDSEVITTAMLLRSMIERAAAHAYPAEKRRRKELGLPPRQPVTLCLEFRDVLTRRLLRQQPELLDTRCNLPAHAGLPPKLPPEARSVWGWGAANAEAKHGFHFVDVVYFHRNHLETAALSLSTHSTTSWYVMRHLLDAYGEVDVNAEPVTAVLKPQEMVESCFSFYDLAARCSEHKLGVLIGVCRQRRSTNAINEQEASRAEPFARTRLKRWFSRGGALVDQKKSNELAEEKLADAEQNRGAESEPQINPPNKDLKRSWSRGDTLLLIQRRHTPGRARKARDLEEDTSRRRQSHVHGHI